MPHVIIRGPAGVGKTTVARMLAERIHGVYCSIDERIDAMQVQGEEEGGIPRTYFLAAQGVCLPQAQQALATGTSVVLDGNFYWPEQFTHLAAHLSASAASARCMICLPAFLWGRRWRPRGRPLLLW